MWHVCGVCVWCAVCVVCVCVWCVWCAVCVGCMHALLVPGCPSMLEKRMSELMVGYISIQADMECS